MFLPRRNPAGPRIHQRGRPARTSARWSPPGDAGEISRAWREACAATPGAHQTISTCTGPTIRTPRIGQLSAGPPVSFIVELLPGQLVDDLRDAATRLAPVLGAKMLRLTERGLTYVRVELLVADPLVDVVPAVRPVASALNPITLGIAEDGATAALYLATAAHLIVQGSTGSGKSVGLYSLLGQLATATDVRITGVDPTGLLLTPWRGRWADVLDPACGTVDSFRYVLVLDQVVREMDARIAAMLAGRDQVELGVHCPVLLVVLEEYPAQLRILDGHDPKAGKTYRALVARLLSEGRKAGIRVVMCTQRADAAIVGAYERAQASHRISYRVDSIDGLRMLHSDITPELAAGHASAPPGVALATMPGRPLLRLRSPLLTYADYVAAVGRPGVRGLRVVS